MITLTERAAAAILRLSEERAEPGQYLRMFITSGGCSGMEYGMGFGEPLQTDIRMQDHDVDFFVDSKSLKLLDGSEVDFDDGLSGKGFEIRNPNADSTCGCGRSFA